MNRSVATPRRSHRTANILRLLSLLCINSIFALSPLRAQSFEQIDPLGQTNNGSRLTQGELTKIVEQMASDMQRDLPIAGANSVQQVDASDQLTKTLLSDPDAVVTVGLLKKVAKPFYDRLIGVGYTADYPWANTAYPPDDALATSEQARQIFHFQLSSPLVLLVVPTNGTSFPASRDVYAGVEATLPKGRTIAKVEFFADSNKIGEAFQRPYGIDWKQPPTGTHHIVAVLTDDQGTKTATKTADISVVRELPKVNLVSERPAYTQFTGKLHAEILGMQQSELKNLTLNGESIPPQTGQFALDVKLKEGNNPFTLLATDDQGRTAQASISLLCDTIAPKITISSPKPDAAIKAARIDVEGTVSDASPIAALSVNGIKAFIKGDHYQAFNVPVVPGAHPLQLQAADIAGNRAQVTLMVNGIGTGPDGTLADAVTLQATPQSGFGPLAVTFTPHLDVPGTIQEIGYDFVGDHTSVQSPTDQAPLVHVYATPGEFHPIMTVKTSEGSFSSRSTVGADSLIAMMMLAAKTGKNPEDQWPPPTIHVSAPPQIQTLLSVADPVDLAVSEDGSLYVLSRATATVTEYSRKGDVIRSLANLGAKPCGLDIDMKGNVYVALTGNNQVAKFKPTAASFEPDLSFNHTGQIGNPDQSAGTGEKSFDAPYDVAVDVIEDAIYVSDTNNNRIVKYKTDGQFETVIGRAGTGLTQFDHPKGMCFGGPEWLTYVADAGNHRVVVIGNDSARRTVGSAGNGEAQFGASLNLAANRDGIFIVDTGNDRVEGFDATRRSGEAGNPFVDFLWATDAKAGFRHPEAIACAPDLLGTTLYLADTGNNRIVSIKISRGEPPEEVWNQMRKRIAAHDTEGALACFSEQAKEQYRQFFQQTGQEQSAKFVEEAGKISVVSIGNDTAEYNINQNMQGQIVSFHVHFVRENGKWKIEEF